jgi:hypothetical protein
MQHKLGQLNPLVPVGAATRPMGLTTTRAYSLILKTAIAVGGLALPGSRFPNLTVMSCARWTILS